MAFAASLAGHLPRCLLSSSSRSMSGSALTFRILAECPVSKARVAEMALPHQTVDTPVFMPVGTQGTMKGVTTQQLLDMDCQIMLGNTYHLGNRPVSAGECFQLMPTTKQTGMRDPGQGRWPPPVHGLEQSTADSEANSLCVCVCVHAQV